MLAYVNFFVILSFSLGFNWEFTINSKLQVRLFYFLKKIFYELLLTFVDLLLLIKDLLLLSLLFFFELKSFSFDFFLFLFDSFFKFFKLLFEVLNSKNQVNLFHQNKQDLGDICNQVEREKCNHWFSHIISSCLNLYEISKANKMIIHQHDEDLIVLLPKVNILLVRLEPANVNYHEDTQKVAAENLEVTELLKENKYGCKD